MFESILYSFFIKSMIICSNLIMWFESSVNSYGRKTGGTNDIARNEFESSVDSYGRKHY